MVKLAMSVSELLYASWSFAGAKDGLHPKADPVDDAHNARIDRKLLRFRREAGAGPLHAQHHLSLAGAHRVDHDKRPSRRFQVALIVFVDTQRFDDQQLLTDHRFDLLGGDDTACDTCEKHDG